MSLNSLKYEVLVFNDSKLNPKLLQDFWHFEDETFGLIDIKMIVSC